MFILWVFQLFSQLPTSPKLDKQIPKKVCLIKGTLFVLMRTPSSLYFPKQIFVL